MAVPVLVLLAAGILATPGVAEGSPPVEQVKLAASDGFPEDGFGSSVAVDGDTIVVGAAAVADLYLDQGSAYVYTPDGLGGYDELELTASDGYFGDWFGNDVAVSGDTIVVGRYTDDVVGTNSGSAYVYTPDGLGGYDETKLVPSDKAHFDFFGSAVAVWGDTIVVSAVNDDVGGTNTGSVYVYTPDGLGGYDEAKLTASDPTEYGFFGKSVAVSGDTIVVGAGDDVGARASGAAYVYTPDGLGGYDEAKLKASDGAEWDYFGSSVAVSGDTILVGAWADDDDAGSAYVYRPDGLGGYSESKLTASDRSAGNRFGADVAASADTIVVGSWLSASAYVYRPDGLGGYAEAKLTASDPVQFNVFGESVAASGETVLVGAPGPYSPELGSTPGTAYVYASTPPTAPTVGSASSGDGQAMVSWSAPASDGGRPVTGYVVTPYVGLSPRPSQIFASTATTQTVTGLVNGTQYRFRVQAINAIGTGGYSTVTNPIIPAPVGQSVPGVPTIGSATAGNASASVSWTAPASDGGSPITGYRVTPYVGFSPQPAQMFSSTATTEVVTGLTNGTTYRFRVQAINAIGPSGYSTATNPVIPVVPTAPGAPTILSNAVAGDSSATVSWTAPASDGGSPITGYRVTPYVGYSARPAQTFNSTSTTQVVTGLTNGTTYRFRVQAINAIGPSGYSTATNTVIPTS